MQGLKGQQYDILLKSKTASLRFFLSSPWLWGPWQRVAPAPPHTPADGGWGCVRPLPAWAASPRAAVWSHPARSAETPIWRFCPAVPSLAQPGAAPSAGPGFPSGTPPSAAPLHSTAHVGQSTNRTLLSFLKVIKHLPLFNGYYISNIVQITPCWKDMLLYLNAELCQYLCYLSGGDRGYLAVGTVGAVVRGGVMVWTPAWLQLLLQTLVFNHQPLQLLLQVCRPLQDTNSSRFYFPYLC